MLFRVYATVRCERLRGMHPDKQQSPNAFERFILVIQFGQTKSYQRHAVLHGNFHFDRNKASPQNRFLLFGSYLTDHRRCCSCSGELSTVENRCCSEPLPSFFVDALPHMPSHRRILFFHRILKVRGLKNHFSTALVVGMRRKCRKVANL